MKKHNELIAALLLNAYSTDRLYYALTNKPEPDPENEIKGLIGAWKYMVTNLEAETKQEDAPLEPTKCLSKALPDQMEGAQGILS